MDMFQPVLQLLLELLFSVLMTTLLSALSWQGNIIAGFISTALGEEVLFLRQSSEKN